MPFLENDMLKVELNPQGAEIISIIGKGDNINYMWKRDKSLWGSSAPILFPIVGALNNDTCLIEGKEYHMTQHGFARHNVFITDQVSPVRVDFTLESNEKIITQYPYQFRLIISYELEGCSLSCTCKVVNIDSQDIYFQIGGHPAFACPFTDEESSDDYYLEFSHKETLEQKVLLPEKKCMSHETRPFFENERRFFVRQSLFANDAIVFKNFKSKTVSLKSINHDKAIHVTMTGFDHLGLWASKHVGGLLAIEPWVGHIDYEGFAGEFKDKESVVQLACENDYQVNFTVTIDM